MRDHWVRLLEGEEQVTWAIAVRGCSYKSLFLPNSGRFFPRQIGNSVLNFASCKTV